MAKSKKKSGKKGKKSKKLPKSLRKGALPRTVDDVMAAGLGALRDAQKAGGDQFDALVARGREIQETGSRAAREAVADVEKAVDRMLGDVRDRRDSVADAVQDRVEGLVEATLGRLGVPGRSEVAALRARVESLTARLQDGAGTASSGGGVTDRSVFEVRSRDDGWAIQRVGTSRASAVLKTKKEALREARDLARRHAPSTLVVFNLDGGVSTETDYDAG